MSFLKNTVSLLAVFCVVPAAFGATARPGVMNTATAISATGAARRVAMPTMTSYITGTSGGITNDNNYNSLMGSIECIEAYTECIKSDDACGEDMSECTTNVLFHGKMPQCVSTLAQCKPEGINALFGTDSVTQLSHYDEYDSSQYDAEDGEVIRYTYPTDGSVLGQMIISAAIENQYDTQTCVKRYMSCLNKDSVCGADFELCTDDREFKKQALFCDSTLARCQADGVRELFGVPKWSPYKTLNMDEGKIADGSRIRAAIDDGADLAALNAVSTCYRVVEQCFLGACTANPLRCIEGSSTQALITANNIYGKDESVGGIGKTWTDTVSTSVTTTDLSTNTSTTTTTTETITKSDVNRYLRTSCQDTIGANKFCHMTFLGKNPSKKDLADVDVQSEVFDYAISERKPYVESKIQDLMTKFDKDAKDKCVETIRSCAMRSCGGGIGSVCYAQAIDNTSKAVAINSATTRNEIKGACAAIVNTDVNCQYAYASLQKDDNYSYNFIKTNVFDTLFPEETATGSGLYAAVSANDPIGVVSSLNASLSTSYNDAALAQMKKQCKTITTNCVKSMCGTDYQNCYRNRTDVQSNITNTKNPTFDSSMNKVGGVLDYTIVLGLCMNTVKNADVCDEHLKIQAKKVALEQGTTTSWGGSTDVAGAWISAGTGLRTPVEGQVHARDENGNYLCKNAKGEQGLCDDVVDGVVFDEPVMIDSEEYQQNAAATTLFKELLIDLEYEAQAKYNAKLTKQQNMCMSANAGGIMGRDDNGSTFMWVKLKSGKVPKNYAVDGLEAKDFAPSNDLYGSFCRVRVNLQSTDPVINDYIKNQSWATTYFAAGDAFTCGSWIPKQALSDMAEKAAEDVYTKDKKKSDTILQTMLPIAALVGGGIGGAYLGAGIEDGSVFGGLSNKGAKAKNFESNKTKCKTEVASARTELNKITKAQQSLGMVKVYFDSASSILDEINGTAATVEWPANISDTITTTTAGNPATCGGTGPAGTGVCVGNLTLDAAKAEINAALKNIENQCAKAERETKKDSNGNEKDTKADAAIAGAVTTGVVGSVLTWGVTRSIIDAKRAKEEQEAIDEFMEALGSKINCVVGGDSLAEYGDVVVTSME